LVKQLLTILSHCYFTVLHGTWHCEPCTQSSQDIFSFDKVGPKRIRFYPYYTKVRFREGNYTQVRIAAFDGLFLTKWYTPQIMRYVLAIMAHDPSRVIRRHVARNACYSLALLVQMGDMRSTSKEVESLLIEEDGNSQEKTKESKKSEMEAMIKVLRKDREVGKNEVLREFLMPIALYILPCRPVCSLLISKFPEYRRLIMKFDGAFSNLPISLFDLLMKPLLLSRSIFLAHL
jgi:hypothetical protein